MIGRSAIEGKLMTRILFVAACSFAALFAALQSAHAVPVNIANGALVVGGSGTYSNNAYNAGGGFDTSNVTNGVNASPDNNLGSTITETFLDDSYWLSPDGATTGYFVIDLGSPQSIGFFEIFNTRNGNADDRGTGNFSITGGNAVTFVSGFFGSNLSGPTTLLASGTLTTQTYPGSDPSGFPLTPDLFNSIASGPFRYLRFDALSRGAAGDKGFPPAGVGLNELRVFEAVVPEPATFVPAALGLIGLSFLALLKKYRRA